VKRRLRDGCDERRRHLELAARHCLDIGVMGLAENSRITDRNNRAIGSDTCDVRCRTPGYGNPVNVTHTVRSFEEAGVAGVTSEDQVSPKRCGHMAGKEVIPLEADGEEDRGGLPRPERRCLCRYRADGRARPSRDSKPR